MTLGNTYLHPLYDYNETTLDIVLTYTDYGRELIKKKNLTVTKSIYTDKDSKNCDFSSLLDNAQTDQSMLLIEFFSKTLYDKNVKWEGHRTIEELVSSEEYKKFLTNFPIDGATLSKEISYELDVNYIESVNSFDCYSLLASDCFENLCISKKSFIHKSRNYHWREYSEELTKHLKILNKLSKKRKVENITEVASYGYLGSKGIISSGIGSNEASEKFDCRHPFDESKTIKCIPHTKLFKPNSDERIYFNWGTDVDNRIIIGHIGRHKS